MIYSSAKHWSAIVFGTISIVLTLASLTFAQCPTPEKVREGFRKLANRDFDVVKVEPSVITGLCEVQYKSEGKFEVTYTDSSGDYFVAGQILNTQTNVNLTRELVTNLNRLTPEEMKQLEKLTAFTVGKSDKFVYFATDPECPFCKKGEAILKNLTQNDQISVRFLLYPLPMHKGADESCISIICDNKGLEGLESVYKSANQCADGKKTVEETVAFMNKKGISGTPVYIFPDGVYHLGVMNEQEILNHLNVPGKK